MTRFARYAWTVLGINLLVILWGAYVRASVSGAGCGAHWPLCNGVMIPQSPKLATIIELAHRASSGLALVAVIALAIWAQRIHGLSRAAKRSAIAALLFICSEAAVGAGLVLFKMVARNESIARGWWISAHLTNTFLLLAALALTAWYSSGAPAPRRPMSRPVLAACLAMLAAALLLGVSGAITALGDTLFPAVSLREGMTQDFNGAAHLFLRLRVWHPLLAVTFAVGAAMTARTIAARLDGDLTATLARALAAILTLQVAIGAANLLLLAPVWLQIVHLLIADGVWIGLVLFSAAALSSERRLG
jgi:heme A synthase